MVGLVVGVAAGSASNQNAVVLAGIAGLLAGAFSMAAGEWVSMRTQRELFEREIALERHHIERFPDEEEAHLAELLRANGLDEPTAARVANEVHREIEPALEFHARFELGINPQELGSPNGAAIGSFLSFLVGGLVPIVPWFFAAGVLGWSVAMSAVGLLTLGALVTRFTQQSPVRSALRQLGIGAASGAITYVIGYLVGVTIT
jgi:VIT1/CCC1 family predicted Fe2+/Mn2+ transporter